MESVQLLVVGGGLAGVEAAWAAAGRGVRVILLEMRPVRGTAVHRTGDLAELVCSNSLKSRLITNASGVLKEEMRLLGSVVLAAAERHAVSAGEALAVDREAFAREVTQLLESHPLISVRREEVRHIPRHRPLVLATGPLTTHELARELQAYTGEKSLAFFDAVAPTVTLESIDLSRVFRASRRKRGQADGDAPGDDYLNCPMDREQYRSFWREIVAAEVAQPHNPEDAETPFFEMCLPIEELAKRGEQTLAYGPMRPVGLIDPRTGRRPYAVVQLRQENKAGTLWGLVGFQTRLKWGEQKRIFRMIPGLENADFVRYGVVHRNIYVSAPRVLELGLQVRGHPGLFLAGQITGVEGYLESAAMGLLAGINCLRWAHGLPPVEPPEQTVMGSLCRYLRETDPDRFAPMNANFGILPEPCVPVRGKREKALYKAEQALQAMRAFAEQIGCCGS
ncbi:MAG: methylenetetrahydrofolate--tRNA-(uracil(54)-C(5))-methyltransferase (FADH(2)-oxidizing) TrmFO [Chthonomonadales bacterium]